MIIGFIGLGRMGKRMAARLLAAGHSLVVYDTDQNASQRMADDGATVAESLNTLAQQADAIFLSLPTPNVVEAVTRQLSGGRARIIVDLSTTGPKMAKQVGAQLKTTGITLIDAPVSGGTTGAEAGTLTIMLSGDEQALAEVQPYLNELGKHFYLGSEPGQAQSMKVINNTLCAVANVSAFEGLVLGTKLGLDAETMLNVINASSGRSFATEVKVPQCILDRSFPMRFSTDLLDKDVGLCLSEADDLGVPMPVSVAARQFLQQGIDNGFGAKDYAELITMIEREAGVCFGQARETQ